MFLEVLRSGLTLNRCLPFLPGSTCKYQRIHSGKTLSCLETQARIGTSNDDGLAPDVDIDNGRNYAELITKEAERAFLHFVSSNQVFTQRFGINQRGVLLTKLCVCGRIRMRARSARF